MKQLWTYTLGSVVLLLTSAFTLNAHAQDTLKIWNGDVKLLDGRQTLTWVNEYVLWIGTNSDNIGIDTTHAEIDSTDPHGTKYDLHFHVVDAPNPRLWFILFHTNYPTVHMPLDASGTQKVTFWIKAPGTAKPLWLWFEDASYSNPGQIGQSARITIDGGEIFDSGKVVQHVPFNGTWQFVSLPWSLIQSNDTSFVANSFHGSVTNPISHMDRSMVRNIEFDSNVYTLVPRPPIGQGYISDYYIDQLYFVPSTTTDIQGRSKVAVPVLFNLYQNYPNPFNPSTEIRFDLPTYADVTLRVYNVLGQEIKTLIDQRLMNPGSYTVRWDGTNQSGVLMPSGEYLYKLQASHYSETKKMVLIR